LHFSNWKFEKYVEVRCSVLKNSKQFRCAEHEVRADNRLNKKNSHISITIRKSHIFLTEKGPVNFTNG